MIDYEVDWNPLLQSTFHGIPRQARNDKTGFIDRLRPSKNAGLFYAFDYCPSYIFDSLYEPNHLISILVKNYMLNITFSIQHKYLAIEKIIIILFYICNFLLIVVIR